MTYMPRYRLASRGRVEPFAVDPQTPLPSSSAEAVHHAVPATSIRNSAHVARQAEVSARECRLPLDVAAIYASPGPLAGPWRGVAVSQEAADQEGPELVARCLFHPIMPCVLSGARIVRYGSRRTGSTPSPYGAWLGIPHLEGFAEFDGCCPKAFTLGAPYRIAVQRDNRCVVKADKVRHQAASENRSITPQFLVGLDYLFTQGRPGCRALVVYYAARSCCTT